MTSMTRGPLPAEVYWRRRLVVLTIALLLVVGVAKVLGGGSDGSSGQATGAAASARTSADPSADPSAGSTGSAGPGEAEATDKAGRKARRAAEAAAQATATAPPPPPPTPTPLEPVGECADEDIQVVPSVGAAQVSVPVLITLTLRTLTNPACTWRMSPESLAVKITSGRDLIFTTTECPSLVPPTDVVVRRDVDAVVTLTWKPKRSDDECSRHTHWAEQGFYHVSVAALGGEPASVQFELGAPPAPAPTPTAPQPSFTPDPVGALAAEAEQQAAEAGKTGKTRKDGKGKRSKKRR